MLRKSVKMQMSVMIRRKSVIFAYGILLFFALSNFYYNLCENIEVKSITEMFCPIKTLTLSDWSNAGFTMMQYYPILVIVPTACAYLIDRDTRIKMYLQSRIGDRMYWYGKLISVFLITFIVFIVPFITELLLSCVCFDMESNLDPSNFEYFNVIEDENIYMLSSVFLKNKVLYAVIMTLLWGVVAGVLAVFNFAITTLPGFKFKVFAFFPIYLLFYGISLATKFLKLEYTTNYFFVLRMFYTGARNELVYFLFLLCLLIVSIVLIEIKIKRDEII